MDYFLAFSLDFTSAEGIFTYIAVFATILSGFVMLFSLLFGGDHDALSMDHAMDSDMGVFSLRSVVGFFLGFGWAGLITLSMEGSLGLALILAFVSGLCIFLLIALLMRFIYSLKSDGTLDYSSLVGYVGTVYVTIPPRHESGGQVRIAHPSQLLFLSAVQEGETPLSLNTPVLVTEINGGILTVKPN